MAVRPGDTASGTFLSESPGTRVSSSASLPLHHPQGLSRCQDPSPASGLQAADARNGTGRAAGGRTPGSVPPPRAPLAAATSQGLRLTFRKIIGCKDKAKQGERPRRRLCGFLSRKPEPRNSAWGRGPGRLVTRFYPRTRQGFCRPGRAGRELGPCQKRRSGLGGNTSPPHRGQGLLLSYCPPSYPARYGGSWPRGAGELEMK